MVLFGRVGLCRVWQCNTLHLGEVQTVALSGGVRRGGVRCWSGGVLVWYGSARCWSGAVSHGLVGFGKGVGMVPTHLKGVIASWL